MYLSNKDLYCEIIVSKAQGRLTRKAERMLETLGTETIKKMVIKYVKSKKITKYHKQLGIQNLEL